MKKKKEARKTVTLRKDLHKRLKISATEWSGTLEKWLDDIVEQWLKK